MSVAACQIYYAAAVLAVTTSSVFAQVAPPASRDSARARVVDTVVVRGRIDNLLGVAATASEGRVGAVDLRARPITREGELLETVPGVIVTQHSGDGKANQYFVRGFNLDHGTDFRTLVEGMPLNMPTHGHGQGYTDLNFLIPELVDHLEYKLGVYSAELGDFGSAGGAEFHLLRALPRPFVTLDAGQNGLTRVVGGGSSRMGSGNLLLAGEIKRYNGPWDLPENIRKFSGVARFTVDNNKNRLSVLALGYRNTWNASDQIPQRAVDAGIISRFGQIDSTDGGEAQRYSISANLRRIGSRSFQDYQVFAIRSDLSLFSNFSYLLGDPADGDQFGQEDHRTIFGANATHTQVLGSSVTHTLKLGMQSRADLIGEVGLHATTDRVRTGTVRNDKVREITGGIFAELQSQWSSLVRTVVGVRGDGFSFNVTSDRAENSGTRTAGIVSPKASLILAPSRSMEVYLSGGFGFHSNDARGTTITIDPATGDPAEQVDPVVRSRGAEIGLRLAPVEGLQSTLTAWTLRLDSELLFVGDAGATEASDASRRDGVTWANFYRVTPRLSVNADLSFARAKLLDVPESENHIPGALENVVAAGIAWTPPGQGVFGSVRLRHFGSYPLIEDNSVQAAAATLVNADIGYQLASGIRLRASVLNLADSRSADIQYFYASRLPGEATDGIEDVHFHPVEPRQLRFSINWVF